MTEQSTIGEIVAGNVRRFREDRGWSRRELVEECQRAGHDALTMTEDTIVNIETGRRNRRLDVDELFVLALALDVSIGSLLMPQTHTPRDRIVIGDRRMTATQAWEWIEGRGGPPTRKGDHPRESAERSERWYLSRPAWLRTVQQHPAVRSVERLAYRINHALTSAGETRRGHLGQARWELSAVDAELRLLEEGGD